MSAFPNWVWEGGREVEYLPKLGFGKEEGRKGGREVEYLPKLGFGKEEREVEYLPKLGSLCENSIQNSEWIVLF